MIFVDDVIFDSAHRTYAPPDELPGHPNVNTLVFFIPHYVQP